MQSYGGRGVCGCAWVYGEGADFILQRSQFLFILSLISRVPGFWFRRISFIFTVGTVHLSFVSIFSRRVVSSKWFQKSHFENFITLAALTFTTTGYTLYHFGIQHFQCFKRAWPKGMFCKNNLRFRNKMFIVANSCPYWICPRIALWVTKYLQVFKKAFSVMLFRSFI